jgi:signal transduction histidine kinase
VRDAASPSEPTMAAAARWRPSLAQKFAVAFLGLVAAVLVINGAIDMAIIWRDARTQAAQVQQEKATAAADRVVQFVSEIEQQLGWTTRPEWASVGIDQRRYDFIRLVRQAPAITELVYVDSSGREQLKRSRLEPESVGSNADYSADPRYVATMRDKIYYGPVTFRRGSEPYMTIGMAHAGRNPGATIADVNLKLAWDVVTAIRAGATGYAFITDPAGRLLAHPDMNLVLRNSDLTGLPQVKAALTAGADAPDATNGIGPDGRQVISAHAKIPKVGWNVFVELPAAEALGPVWSALYQTLALLALGVVLAGLAGTLLARRMTVPITELAAGARKLGEGDLAQRIPVRTGDEIGALAQRFNVMAGHIQEAQETLERKVETRTADLNESLERQTATSDVLRVIASSPSNVQPVFDAIAERSNKLIAGLSTAVISIVDDQQILSSFTRTSPEGDAFLQANFPRKFSTAPQAEAVSKGEVYVVENTEDWPGVQELGRKRGFRSMLFVPLMRDGASIGMISVTRREAGVFADRDIQLLKTFADQAVIAIENVRLFNETKEALERQTATADVLKVIAASPTDIEPVLRAVAESACQLCDAYDCAVLLRKGDDLYFSAHFGPIPIGLEKWPVNRNWTAGRAVIDQTPVHVHDLMGPEGEEFPDGRELSVRMGHRTIISLPLLREGQSIGAMVVRRKEVHPFSDKQIELLRTFADQAAIAINNVHLFDEVQAKQRDLEESLRFQTASGDVLKVISRSPDKLQPVLSVIVETSRELCGAVTSSIFLLRDGKFHVAAQSASPPPYIDALRENPIALDAPGSVLARAAREGRAVQIVNTLEDPERGLGGPLDLGPARAVVAVPLILDGAVIGGIVLGQSHLAPFTPRQNEAIESFADQAVIAISNVGLFEQVQERTRELTQSLQELHTAQDRLVQTEKLASLGQLTAGIAHEIKNPLNFVNNFSSLSAELVDELNDVLKPAPLDDKAREEVEELTGMLKGNLEKVVQHGRRADSIVKNMLLHSREGSGERRPADINAIVEESLNLAYHGARAEKPGFNITLERNFDPAAGSVELFPQEITRVVLNLISNGFYAAAKRKEDGVAGFEPTLRASTRDLGKAVEIRIRDNGAGIPDAVREKIFNPFFTTKPAGEGTGLGLSMSHDIVVKQHGGALAIETEAGCFTEFIITLPRTTSAQIQAGGTI